MKTEHAKFHPSIKEQHDRISIHFELNEKISHIADSHMFGLLLPEGTKMKEAILIVEKLKGSQFFYCK